MIGYLKGKIKFVSEKYVIIDCNGVGYRVELGTRCLEQEVGSVKDFYIYTHVRESELRLFGFKTNKELTLFEMLIDVNGVGPKVGIALISHLGTDRIVNSILQKDAENIKISGVGLKTANKIVLELVDKLKEKGFRAVEIDKKSASISKIFQKNIKEAKEALISLGYGKNDIARILEEIVNKKECENMSSEQLLKFILSKL